MASYSSQNAPKPVPEPRAGYDRWEVIAPYRGPLSDEAQIGDVILLPHNHGGYLDHTEDGHKKPKASPSSALIKYEPHKHAPHKDKHHG